MWQLHQQCEYVCESMSAFGTRTDGDVGLKLSIHISMYTFAQPSSCANVFNNDAGGISTSTFAWTFIPLCVYVFSLVWVCASKCECTELPLQIAVHVTWVLNCRYIRWKVGNASCVGVHFVKVCMLQVGFGFIVINALRFSFQFYMFKTFATSYLIRIKQWGKVMIILIIDLIDASHTKSEVE